MILSGNIIIKDNKEIFMLFRDNYLETPGGKVEKDNCKYFSNPSLIELEKEATRELFEEVSGIDEIKETKYIGSYKFVTPKGVDAVAHKFLRVVSGNLCAKEKIFDKEKSKYYSIKELETADVTPDFPYFLGIVKSKFLV